MEVLGPWRFQRNFELGEVRRPANSAETGVGGHIGRRWETVEASNGNESGL